jgi:hypothetical protein
MKFNKKFYGSCDNWIVGFKGTMIDNSFGKCKIDPPNICYYEILDGFFDYSWISGENCSNMKTNLFSINEDYLLDKNAKIIGYPRSENWSIFPECIFSEIQKTAFKYMINMEDPNIDQTIKDSVEVTTNFYKNPPEVTIDLKYNEELVQQRRELFQRYKDDVLAKNVLFVFIDSLSRSNFRRKLPRFYKWLESKYNPGDDEESYKDAKFETFQFLKYHGVGRLTALNMIPTFFGVYNIYYAGKYFLTEYKDRGYITGQTLTFCGKELFDIDGGAIEHMQWDNYDHEMNSLYCDGNFTPLDSPYSILSGVNSIRQRCIYNKSATQYSLEYMHQFFNKYKDEAKFFRIGFTEAHEGSLEVIKHSDDDITEFFIQMEKEGHLDETIVFIQADHGFSFVGPYSALEFEDYVHELVLPASFLILPTKIKNYDSIRKVVRHNENAMVTPFILYNSLMTILNDDENVRFAEFDELNDIFTTTLSYDRDCDIFYDKIYFNDKEFLCRCHE